MGFFFFFFPQMLKEVLLSFNFYLVHFLNKFFFFLTFYSNQWAFLVIKVEPISISELSKLVARLKASYARMVHSILW